MIISAYIDDFKAPSLLVTSRKEGENVAVSGKDGKTVSLPEGEGRAEFPPLPVKSARARQSSNRVIAQAAHKTGPDN